MQVPFVDILIFRISSQAIILIFVIPFSSVLQKYGNMRYDVTWIIEGLQKPGKTKGGLAKALGRAPSMVSNLIKGERELKAHEIEKVATYLEVPNPFASTLDERVTRLEGGEAERIPIVGVVEAGAFREIDGMNQDEFEYISSPPDPRWPDARRMAMRVEGDSMNALSPVPIMPGAIIACIDFEDISDRYVLRNGAVLVVQRQSSAGHMREWSVKQLEIQDDRYIFHPRSRSPKHKPIVVKTDLQADDGTEVSVLALVRRIDNPMID